MNKVSFKEKKKVAFVVSGGAVKAACFHLGVCIALEKKGIQFNGGVVKGRQVDIDPQKLLINTYVGSSAGSVCAALLAAGYSTTDVFQSFLSLKQHTQRLPKVGYKDLFHLAKPNLRKYLPMFGRQRKTSAMGGIEAFFKNRLTLGGFFTTKGLEHYMRYKAMPTDNFKELVPDLFVVATQLDHPYKVIFSKHKNIEARPEHHALYDSSVQISSTVAASTSLPPIYQPYPLLFNKEKIYFYDGEIRETLSTHVAKDVGCDLVIASYTHQPYTYHPEVGSLVNYGMSTVMIQAIYQTIEQKIHTSKRLWKNKKIALDTVYEFFNEHHLPRKKRDELCDILEKKLQFNKNIDYLFIYPIAQDYRLFLADHFNLSRDHMMKLVKSGFKSAIYHLRNYEF